MARTTTRSTTKGGPEGFSRQVAGNLRRLRKERGWSLVQLSARAGVSRAMLSQVETGKTTPTIAVLWKIATGIGVPFAELILEEEAADVTVVRAGATPAITSPDRKFRSTPVFPHALGPGIELYRITIAAGGASRSAPHARGTVEVVAVEEGRLRLTVAGAEHQLGPGDTASFAADVEHAYAAGDGGCVLYDVIRYATPRKRR
jgi:transcriptional regulator with XRE-family HTH domain